MTFRASGMRAWLLQRLSSVYMVAFIVATLLWYATSGTISYTVWRELLANPLIAVAVALFFSSLLIHAWIGMRDVLIDYMPIMGLRLILLLGIAVFLIAMGIWLAFILISVVKV
jgi:succinate dehydrogenase / fumarate reductase membrane anchor subunit